MRLAAPDPRSLIARGLAVFPLPPGGKRAEPGWQRRCLTAPAAVARQWRHGDNIGISCRASAVVALDLDHTTGADGPAMFTTLCEAHENNWPDTLTVRTPHGGLHLYFHAPPERTIVSTSSGRSGLGPGIDTRGPGRVSGGYLVGPGSIVVGVPYVIERDTSIQQLPTWLADLLERDVPHEATETVPVSSR